MDPRPALISDINKVLQKHGFTTAIQHNVQLKNGYLQLALRSVDEEEAWKRIADNAMLVTDFKWNWSKPFKYGGTLLTLIDFDQRQAKPWVCSDARGSIYYLSTKEIALHALDPVVTTPLPRDENGHFAKVEVPQVDYSKWG